MRIYRNGYRTLDQNSGGYSYHTSKRDADRAAAKWRKDNADDPYPEVDQDVRNFRPTLFEIVCLLELWGSHPDNG